MHSTERDDDFARAIKYYPDSTVSPKRPSI